MQAIRIHATGGPEVMRLDELPTPEPGPGQARVKLAAIGVNFIDVYFRKGLYAGALPQVLGREAAGVIDAVGAGVSDVQVGDRVAYSGVPGAYAEYAVAPVDQLVPVPASVGLDLAAAVLLQGMTAHYLATSTFPLQPGHTALIHAAAGGTGQLLTQIAKRCGARVFATVSTEEKAQLAREAGADDIILYSRDDFEAGVKALTGGKGVDVVYDSVGLTTFDKSLRCLRPRGYMVLFGQSSGPVPPFDPQLLNARGGLFLTRPTLNHYTATREELLWRSSDLFNWIAAGELRVSVDQTFPLAQAAEAHRYLEDRQTKGKVLLVP